MVTPCLFPGHSQAVPSYVPIIYQKYFWHKYNDKLTEIK